MKKYNTTQETAKELGISTRTLERWRANGKFVPAVRTRGNHSRYSAEQIWDYKKENRKMVTLDMLL